MTYETPEIECRECHGEGVAEIVCGYERPCDACNGKGWRAMTPDEEADAAEAAYERQMEDYYGGNSPVTLGEQHHAAWKQKQALKATGGDHA